MKKIITKISLFVKNKKMLAIMLALCMFEVGYAAHTWLFYTTYPDLYTSYGVYYDACGSATYNDGTTNYTLVNVAILKSHTCEDLDLYKPNPRTEITIPQKIRSSTYAIVKLEPGLFTSDNSAELQTINMPNPVNVTVLGGSSSSIKLAPDITGNCGHADDPEADYAATFGDKDVVFPSNMTTAEREAYLKAGYPDNKLPGAVVTNSGTCGESLAWSYSNGTLTITGSGDMYNFTNGSAPWYGHRTNITSISLPNGITSIGAYAFQGCSAITSISLPAGITSLPTGAFINCTSLNTVNIFYASDVISLPGSGFMATYYVFNGANNNQTMSAIVPSAVLADYADSDWSNRFQFEPQTEIGSCGTNANYMYMNHVLMITGSGAMADYNVVTTPWKHIESYITSISIGKDITSIGQKAFYEMPAVTSVTFAANSTLTTIGADAFGRIYTLNSISLPSSLTTIDARAFYYCTGLTSITIPSGVTTIADELFRYCSGLQSVTFQGNITSIGESVFQDCNHLSSISALPNTLLSIGEKAFAGATATSLSIPASVTTMGSEVFYTCPNITLTLPWTTIPNGINANAFGQHEGNGYAAITLRIPDGADICDYTDKFGTTKLVYKNSTSENLSCQRCGANLYWSFEEGVLTISGTGTTMDNFASNERPWEDHIASITSVVIEAANMTNIGNNAFRNCTNLASVTLGASVTAIGSSAFYGCSSIAEPIYNSHVFALMPNSWLSTHGGDYSIPDGITVIDDDAFSGLSNLTSIVVPNSVTTMDTYLFYGCSALVSATLPSGITEIPRSTFRGCTALTTLYLKGTTISSIGYLAFDGVANNLTIYVPKGTKAAYQTVFSDSANKPSSYVIKEEGVLSDDDASTMAETLTGLIGQTLEEVTTERPIQLNNQYNTLCLPFSMDETQIAESSLADAEIYEFANAAKNGEYLDFHFRPVTTITAGVPYFFRLPQEGSNWTGLDFEDVTFTTATAGSVTHGAVTLIGTLSQVSVSGTDKLYLAAGNELHYSANARNIPPFRAYFSVAGGANFAPKARIVQRENTTTGVENVHSSTISSHKIIENGQLYILKNGVKYNAQGQIVK